jgi:hypothetical protein
MNAIMIDSSHANGNASLNQKLSDQINEVLNMKGHSTTPVNKMAANITI